jgi:tripartite-type tricarboxylate transporter receptor subunit TctC
MFSRLNKAFLLRVVIGLIFPLFCPGVNGLDFPKKPIKVMLASGPGGGNDVVARGIIPYLQQHLGVNVSIDYQHGAGGRIALEKLHRADPDGYAILLDAFPRSVIVEHMRATNFKTRDFVPVFVIGPTSQVLVGHSDNWKTFDEFLKTAKKKTMACGLAGRGTTVHLSGLVLMEKLGIKVNWVPFAAAGEATAALAGKHIDYAIILPTSGVSLIRAGAIRPLLMLRESRDPFFPDIPVPKDLKLDVKLIPVVYGVVAPPRTPEIIVKVLEEAFAKAANEPAFLEWAKKGQIEISPQSSHDFGKIIRESYYPDVERFQTLLKEQE